VSIHGHRLGLIGNNGPITPQGAAKAAAVYSALADPKQPRRCCFLHNTTGFMSFTEAERQGVIKPVKR